MATDAEINKAVARKLGMKWFSNCNCDDGECPQEHFKDYCHSIAAAWELTQIPDLVFELIQSPSGWWTAKILKIGTGMWLITAESKNAPMAICLAFLKLEENK